MATILNSGVRESLTDITSVDRELRGWRLTYKILGAGVNGTYFRTLRGVLRESNAGMDVVRWVNAILDMPYGSRDIRLEFVYQLYNNVPRAEFHTVWVKRAMFMSWASDDLLAAAVSALRKGTRRTGLLYAVEVFEALTRHGMPDTSRLLRVEALYRGRMYPSSTDWNALGDAYAHLGSRELVEELFGAEEIR